jgi:hypothetical protein
MIERFTRPRGRSKARGRKDLLALGAEAGHALPGWADAELGDAVAEAHASVRAAAGAIVPMRPSR